MLDWLAAAAQSRPYGIAVIHAESAQGIEYRVLNDEVAGFAARLATLDLKRGDRVGVLMDNSIDAIRLIHALARVGAVLVALNTRLRVNELRYQVSLAECRLILHDEGQREKALGLVTSERTAIDIEAFTAINVSNAEQYRTGEIDLDDVGTIMFTSGTTGMPKGVQITFGNLFYSALGSVYRIGTHPYDTWLLCLPLYHIGGLSIVWRCCLYNTTVVHLPGAFDPERVIETADKYAVSLMSLVPTQLYRLIQRLSPERRLSPLLRYVLLGGAAVSNELRNEAFDRDIPIAPSYGLTEATSQVATSQINSPIDDVGTPLMFTSVQIVDDHGDAVAPGIYGEIVVSGPTVMKGYLGHSDTNGVFYTGDIGYLDKRGNLHVVQRRTDLILSGGENVYPAEVEAKLLKHPAVRDVIVVGVPSAEWGQQVAAAVVLREGMDVDADTLIAFAGGSLAGYKVPRLIRFVEALPMTASGKINRAAVQQELSTADTDQPSAS